MLLLPYRDAALNAEDMASQSVRLKAEQLRKEEEKVNCGFRAFFNPYV